MFSDKAVNNLEKIFIAGGLATEKSKFTGLNPWQKEMVVHVNNNLKSVILAARRTGKTFTLAFLTCLILLMGKTAIFCLPTGNTVEGVIHDEVEKMLKILERDVPLFFTPIKNQKRDRTWSGGGRLLLLSAKSTNDGYGGSFVVIDEAQLMEIEAVLPIFEPFVNPFLANNTGRIVLTGRGGPKNSLIHAASKLEVNPYKNKILNDQYLGKKYPELQPEFNKAKGLPLYDSHYGCKSLADGGNYLFSSIEKDYKYTPTAKNRVFGIDTAGGVGRDSTVCVLLDYHDGHYIWADHYETNVEDPHTQCKHIYDFIEQYPRHLRSIMIESNFNPMMANELEKNYYYDIRAANIKIDNKQQICKYIMTLNKDGKLIVKDSKVRNELESLIFSVKPNGNWDFKDAHSDYLSALIMAFMIAPGMHFSM